MKQDLTRIAVVLDRSGSMKLVADATISGFNEFVHSQKLEPGQANLKLVQFDDQYEEVFDKPLSEVPALDHQTFVPRGWTALHDAIGRTINLLDNELKNMPEADRPAKVLVLILTDGEENRSTEFTREQIADMVKEKQEKSSWNFVFLGANQDAVLTASGFNIPHDSSLTYNSNAAVLRNTLGSASRYTSDYRSGRRVGFKPAERKASRTPDPPKQD